MVFVFCVVLRTFPALLCSCRAREKVGVILNVIRVV